MIPHLKVQILAKEAQRFPIEKKEWRMFLQLRGTITIQLTYYLFGFSQSSDHSISESKIKLKKKRID